MTEARWSDLAVAAAAADKPSSGSANPILTGAQTARRSAHKVLGFICMTTITWICGLKEGGREGEHVCFLAYNKDWYNV